MPLNSTWPAFDVRTAARLFGAVERQRVGLDLGAPERGLELLGKFVSPAHRACRPRSRVRCAARNRPPCAWRHRRSPGLRRARWRLRPTVRRRERPRRTNPSSPGWRAPVRWRANIRRNRRRRDRPGHRSNRAPPRIAGHSSPDGLDVAGAFQVKAGEQHEQRRRIDAAVIEAERHLAQRRHFAAAHLVQDFSRLGVGERIGGFGLIVGEATQHAARDVRAPPQHLQSGDQAVAAEGGREPGNARIGITPLRRFGHQNLQIGGGAAQHLIEQLIRRLARWCGRTSIARSSRRARVSARRNGTGLLSAVLQPAGEENRARLAGRRGAIRKTRHWRPRCRAADRRSASCAAVYRRVRDSSAAPDRCRATARSQCRGARGACRAPRKDRQSRWQTGSPSAHRSGGHHSCASRTADRPCRAKGRPCARYAACPFPSMMR